MKNPSSDLPAGSSETPLSGAAKFGLIVSAGLTIALFYVFAAASILLLLIILAVELLVALVLLRFGMIRVVTPLIDRHSGLFLLFVRSFWLSKGIEFRVPVTEEDAPALFAFLALLSERMKVAPPKRVVLEMSAGAWVNLGGFRRGADATTLGLGYDLLAGLNEREVEAVLAHEMAHAKLVRRGLKRWLAGGVSRAGKLTNGLTAMVDAHRRALKVFALGEWFLAGANGITRLAVKLLAGYSRQDEFEADRGAAEVCGSAPLRSSLLKLEKMAAKTARIGWSERVAQLQRGDGFTSWLVEELAVAENNPEPVSTAGEVDRFATHPSLRDRLAALPPDTAPPQPGSPAIMMFAHPAAVAGRLVAEIHRLGANQEWQDTRARLRWLKRTRRSGNFRAAQVPGLILFLVGLVTIFFAWADGFRIGILLFALALASGGYWLMLLGRYRDRRALPVPSFAALKASMEPPENPELRRKSDEEREKTLRSDLQTRLAAERSKKRRKELLIAACYDALAQCDYLHAHVAARLGLDIEKQGPEFLLSLAIASASYHQGPFTGKILAILIRLTALRSPSTLWGTGWALVLLGDWAGAEAMFMQCRQLKPGEPTFAALLALCQWQRNKIQSGLEQVRFALSQAPQERELTKLMLHLLLQGGYLREAQELLAGADATIRLDPELTVLAIRIHLLRREFADADRWIRELKEHGVAPHNAIQLGAAHETARLDQTAADFYRMALEKAFYPEAHLGLARLAAHREDKVIAQQELLAALNLSREVGPRGRTPIGVFFEAATLHTGLQDTIGNAQGWLATFTGNAIAGPLSNQVFLLFAANQEAAAKHLQELADALQPAKPSLFPQYVSWSKAPKDQQPVGHVRPGIQRYWSH